jgi:hypothetical protein
MDLFYDYARLDKETRLEQATDGIVATYGKDAIYPAAILLNDKTRHILPHRSQLPHNAFRPASHPDEQI